MHTARVRLPLDTPLTRHIAPKTTAPAREKNNSFDVESTAVLHLTGLISSDGKTHYTQVNDTMKTAFTALSTLTPGNLIEVVAYTQPPPALLIVLEAVCVLVGEEPGWVTAKNLLKRRDFIPAVALSTIENIPFARIRKCRSRGYLRNPLMNIERVSAVSKVGAALLLWVQAIDAAAPPAGPVVGGTGSVGSITYSDSTNPTNPNITINSNSNSNSNSSSSKNSNSAARVVKNTGITSSTTQRFLRNLQQKKGFPITKNISSTTVVLSKSSAISKESSSSYTVEVTPTLWNNCDDFRSPSSLAKNILGCVASSSSTSISSSYGDGNGNGNGNGDDDDDDDDDDEKEQDKSYVEEVEIDNDDHDNDGHDDDDEDKDTDGSIYNIYSNDDDDDEDERQKVPLSDEQKGDDYAIIQAMQNVLDEQGPIYEE